jgi:hypothetical protein
MKNLSAGSTENMKNSESKNLLTNKALQYTGIWLVK